jgi:predicted phage terminase large subunit-like protein
VSASLALPRLRPDQWAIATHPAKTKVIAMGRRWGKTTMSGAIALAAAADGARVAWVVPTYRNARPVWRWIESAVGPLLRGRYVAVNRTDRTVDFPATGGFLGVYSGDNDVGLRGEAFHLAVLEEAARIGETTWTEVIQPALADYDGDALLISTPDKLNWFWQEWQRGVLAMDGEIAAFTAPSCANPMPTIRRAYELAKERVPENVFRQEWDAEFVPDAKTVWNLGWWDETPEHPTRRFAADDPRLRAQTVARWISWDTGFKDTDNSAYTACVVGELTADYRLLVREVWRDQLTFPNLVDQITRVAERYAQDYTGTGEGEGQRRLLRAVVIEDKASGISAVQTLRETAPPWLAELIVPFQPQGSKEQRASLAAVWCKDGCVWLPHPSEDVRWLADFEAELAAFPSGAYLDQVDALSQLVLYVSRYLSQGRTARLAAAQQLAAPANGLAA